MPEPTGEVAITETQESPLISGMPPGMTQADIDDILQRTAPQEPVIDEVAQAIARQRIIDNQLLLEQASAEAVQAAQSSADHTVE